MWLTDHAEQHCKMPQILVLLQYLDHSLKKIWKKKFHPLIPNGAFIHLEQGPQKYCHAVQTGDENIWPSSTSALVSTKHLVYMKSFAVWMELYPPHSHRPLPHQHTSRKNGLMGTSRSSINATTKSWTWYKITLMPLGSEDWLGGSAEKDSVVLVERQMSQQCVLTAMKANYTLTTLVHVQLAGQQVKGLFPSIWHLWDCTWSTGDQFGVLQ